MNQKQSHTIEPPNIESAYFGADEILVNETSLSIIYNLTPDAQGYNSDKRYVMYISGTAHIKGIIAIAIIAYKFPAALTVGSMPNGPPLR